MDFFVCLAPVFGTWIFFLTDFFFFLPEPSRMLFCVHLAGGDHGVLETVLPGLPLELPTRQKASWKELSEGLAHLFPPLLDLCLISVNSFSELIWFPSCL